MAPNEFFSHHTYTNPCPKMKFKHSDAQEEETLAAMNPVQKALYKMLNPLADLKRGIQQQRFLPVQTVYVVHFLCFAIGGFCAYYIFLFSVMLNTCGDCDPDPWDADDDASSGGDDDYTPAPSVPDDDFSSFVLIWEAIVGMVGGSDGVSTTSPQGLVFDIFKLILPCLCFPSDLPKWTFTLERTLNTG